MSGFARSISLDDFAEKPQIVSGLIVSPDPQYQWQYDRWRLYWTGWKGIPAQETLVGQWIAHDFVDPNGRRLHSCVPGVLGYHVPGSCLNIYFVRVGPTREDDVSKWCPFEWEQFEITRTTVPTVVDREKDKGLRRLLGLIDRMKEMRNADL